MSNLRKIVLALLVSSLFVSLDTYTNTRLEQKFEQTNVDLRTVIIELQKEVQINKMRCNILYNGFIELQQELEATQKQLGIERIAGEGKTKTISTNK
tara:strand:- start:299 stop:589 length:291 start_codon:yes stop_codon:yes gene_type:complete